jgi:predicted outer membrane repeat protein
MLTAIVLLGSVVSSPVTSALADRLTSASVATVGTNLFIGITCDDTVSTYPQLQTAVTSSIDGDVICIAESIQLSARLTLDDTSVALVGRDDSAVTLIAPSPSRHLAATSPGDDTLVIDTLTLRGGGISEGGGIAADDYAIYIRNSTLSENNAGAADGGAISARDGDVIVDDSTTFTNNTANTAVSGDGGGAIYVFNGDVTINGNSTFTDNDSGGGAGGAIYANGDVTINGTTEFTDNTAGNSGGAIYTNAGGVTIDDSAAFTNNDAGGVGGAIYADTGNVTTSGGAFTGNTAGGGGGAISAFFGDVTIDDTASTTDFVNNTTNDSGGAIWALIGDVTTNGGTFEGNIAGGPDGGGAIYAGGSVSIDDSTTFTDNRADAGGGGAIFAGGIGGVTTTGGAFTSNYAFSNGGAIYAASGDVVNSDVITFANNSADSSGGSIYAADSVTTSGGTFTNDTSAVQGGAIWAGNDVTTSGGTFEGNSADREGGAIYAGDDVTTSGGTFTNNSADDTTSGFGGAIYASNGDVTTSGSTFGGNAAYGDGGAIWARGPISVTNSTFFGNSANHGGAALSLGNVSLRYTTAVDDSTTAGGVFESGGSLTVLGSVIAPDPAGGSACSTSADDSSYNSFVTDSTCGIGDDTVVGNTSRAVIGLSGPLVTDDSTGARVLIPDDTSILINAAPADLVAGVATDQLQATRGRSPDDSTTVGAVQVLPLVITGQPASTTVVAGATATFAASGLPGVGTTVNYQWQTRANAGASWVDRVGATSPTLTLAPVSAGQNGLQVRALVSDIRDEPLSSSIATLTVTSSPGPGPAVAPGAPRDPRAVPGNEGAEVTWLAPVSSGTSPITSYEVVNDVNGAICRLTVGPNTALSCAMTGLTNGTSYRFRVRAISSAGAGEWSPWSNVVTPSAPPTPRTLVITGTRDGAKVRIRGTSTGLSGSVASPWVRLAGQVGYKQGVNLRPIAANGNFDWSRTSLRKTYVYFTADGIVSNRVIFPSAG